MPSAELELTAINRRGRRIALRVTVTPLVGVGQEPRGALLLMEQSNSGEPDFVEAAEV